MVVFVFSIDKYACIYMAPYAKLHGRILKLYCSRGYCGNCCPLCSTSSAEYVCSVKVLKRYPCLWSMHKPASRRPRLYIVNLQWTPKDDVATLKINGTAFCFLLTVKFCPGMVAILGIDCWDLHQTTTHCTQQHCALQ